MKINSGDTVMLMESANIYLIDEKYDLPQILKDHIKTNIGKILIVDSIRSNGKVAFKDKGYLWWVEPEHIKLGGRK